MTITDVPVAARPRGRRRVVGTVLLWLLLVPGLCWAVLRLGGWDRGPLIPLMAFTPYVALGSLVPLVLTVIRRRWVPAAVAAVTAAALAACVLPRALPDLDRGAATGVELPVMTSNMLFGGADASEIVRLVREHDVAVLAVQEFAPRAETSLAAAGIDQLLPYHELAPESWASGTALYSRYPLTDPGAKRNKGGFQQTWGTIQPPGAAPVFIESVHPLAPAVPDSYAGWRTDLADEPRSDGDNPRRILLGDFNATLDHGPLRKLISHGYHDAADTVGKGLIGTWGPYDGDPIPPVTIDHVLVDEEIGVRDVSVHDVKDSDHRAVVAELTLPAAS
ncbi:endonuclease/exonuclease/phosphatase family metal-dependent hydrolase [Actinoplanes octamycinicus]|uniref:Endonuclease/exonuclease/phosphatase family metal-dependent hydrolase n=1 Tax=Actinoplanes octamycinicus TaxID=135948 RepID=A0A7W7GRS8_9ACTN|nr:endonuclease/exonuclease/phosphatase family protein [Actinoplanes octamycinicus]MBB4737082.1 endonuclease/exonuclease/phosphatase family metal-dependent hydrolase [Actinoplanes octamycinicus]GIE63369.1 endonuclease [Actinoplanes octamycinicus]